VSHIGQVVGLFNEVRTVVEMVDERCGQFLAAASAIKAGADALMITMKTTRLSMTTGVGSSQFNSTRGAP
jgi:hypothetical protein